MRLDTELGFMHLFFKERDIEPRENGAAFSGNDDDGVTTNDSRPNPNDPLPGSEKTILNKPAPSFYQGVTRVFFDILGVGLTLRV